MNLNVLEHQQLKILQKIRVLETQYQVKTINSFFHTIKLINPLLEKEKEKLILFFTYIFKERKRRKKEENTI